MTKTKLFRKAAIAAIIAGPLTAAMATNGYFSHGYGIAAKSMGGAGIAMASDAMSLATNPASGVNIGNGVAFGLDLFMPDRTSTVGSGGSSLGQTPGEYQSGQRQFFVPEFGYNRMLGKDSAFGVVVYGNGGMNTNYDAKVIGGGSDRTNTYSNLEQLFIAPTYSKKVGTSAFGASLNLIYQTFEVRGMQGFATTTYSTDISKVTDNGIDTSTGYAVKLGWTNEISPNVTLGAVYQSRAKMSKFSRYSGLFAEQGSFDIPESYGFGLAIKASPKATVAMDITQINYTAIKSISNSAAGFLGSPSTQKLGSDTGTGFGWSDMTVFKIGVAYDYRSDLTLRVGYNLGKMPLKSEETYFNIIAPATTEQHLTLGATWTLSNKSQLTAMYMFAPRVSIDGVSNGLGNSNGIRGYPENLSMSQQSLGIAYSWKY